jgi:glycosyltransferase involved in cell wall biosynthesis
MKKILYLANLRLPTEKAYGIQIAKMCEAFAGQGLDLTLLYPHRQNQIEDGLFDYYSVKKNFKLKEISSPDFYWPWGLDKIAVTIKNFISAKALVKEALREGADVYYTRDELVAYLLSKKSKNVIFECHRFSNKRKPFYSYVKNKDLKIVAISDGLKKSLVEFGITDSSILIARDGVDLARFNASISKAQAREETGLPLDMKIVLYTGHLFDWKGASVLLEAARGVEALFVFVGGTAQDVISFKQKTFGLDNVLVLGHRPYKDIPVYLKTADVLVLPNSGKEEISSLFTSPLKLFEYMASKRPIVASALLSIKEILNDENSILVEPDKSSVLAESIKAAISDEELALRLSSKAYSDVQQYTWVKRAERILNFIL